MAKVINLNRLRKKAAAEQKKTQAERNRVRHGRTKADKLQERRERQLAEERLEGKRLEHGRLGEDAPETAADEDGPPGKDSD